MPTTISKLKFKTRMADPKRVGRVFCVTGVNKDESLAFITNEGENNTCHSDTESNSSGYISSSSFDYSGEEKRVLTNDQREFQMDRLNQHIQVPKCSTPKESSAVRRAAGSTKSLLVIRKTFGKGRVSQQTDSKTSTTNTDNDSFWDIELPERKNVYSVRSYKPNKSCARSEPLNTSPDASSEIPKMKRSLHGNNKQTFHGPSNDWRRRPYLTLSNSDSDLSKCGKARQHCGRSSDSNISKYNCLPRYRVKVESDTDVAPKAVKRLTEQSTDVYDKGVPVDDSMAEFISSVDKDNLAGILQFYDHVTTQSAYRQELTPRYESVYF